MERARTIDETIERLERLVASPRLSADEREIVRESLEDVVRIRRRELAKVARASMSVAN